MCRIAGIITKTPKSDSRIQLQEMLSTLAHGGPDHEGIYEEGSVLLGHRRLSIIDLSPLGNQPMISSDKKVIISFNGEIFNFQKIREQLETKAFQFATHSDTEVIIRAYEAWGIDSFSRLHGMFAFILYDVQQQKIFLVRDHAGIKPLYFSINADRLLVASEVRAFQKADHFKENEDWKIAFLAFGSLPHPLTTLEGVFQLAKGTFLELNLIDFSYHITPYVNQDSSNPKILNEQQAVTLIRSKTEEAVRAHLIADAPLGVFLSGGIDSSLLTLLADEWKEDGVSSLSVNFQEAEFDETPYQQKVLARTKQTHHVAYQVAEQMFLNSLDDIWNAMDQPSIDGVNSYFVSKCAHQNGLKAVLSGLGADEYFGGYQSVARIRLLRLFRKIPFKPFFSKWLGAFSDSYKRFSYLQLNGPVGDYLFLRGIHDPAAIARLLSIEEKMVWQVLLKLYVKVPPGLTAQEYASFLESEIYMTNQLLKDTDCMSMWHALEVRVPFLDKQLLESVKSIAPAIRFKTTSPKFLLTEAFKALLPEAVVFRKKQGFTFPFQIWFKNNASLFKQSFESNEESKKTFSQFLAGEIHWAKPWSFRVLKEFENKFKHPRPWLREEDHFY